MVTIPYLILFLIPAFAASAYKETRPWTPATPAPLTTGWLIFGLTLIIVIGLRLRVGGDWYNYIDQMEDLRGTSLEQVLSMSDPGYKLLNWLSLELDWGIFGVNTTAAIIFTSGLIAFCRSMPRPWLAASISIPYLVIVVAMGYSRQGIALGCAMLGLLCLERKSPLKFAMWVLLGATFHRSAILLLPLAALAATRSRVFAVVWIGVIGAIGYQALLERDVGNLYENYIERGYQSEGAFVRLAMNAVAAGLFLLLHKRFRLSQASILLWRWMSLLSLCLLGAFFASPGISTALDRLGLYLLPLQLLVFAHLPGALVAKGAQGGTRGWVLAVIAYYTLVLLVWMNFAGNAYAWLPYQTILLDR